MNKNEIQNVIIDLGTAGYIPEIVKHEAIKTIETLNEENTKLKNAILHAIYFINNHTYRWHDTQFGEWVEKEEFEQGLNPRELVNILLDGLDKEYKDGYKIIEEENDENRS